MKEINTFIKYWAKYTIFCIILLCMLLHTLEAQAQRRRKNKDDLEKQREEIERQVSKTEEMLHQTRRTKRKSFNELSLLKKQINLRNKLLSSLSGQVEEADVQIRRIENMVTSMEKDIETFQSSYGKAATLTYKVQNNLSVLLWIFSAQGFRQAWDRILYFREFSRYRKNQIFLIKRTQLYLFDKREQKEALKSKRTELLGKRVEEKNKLDKTIEQKDGLYKELRKSEKEYNKQIVEFKKDLQEIRAQIRQLVMESRKDKPTKEKSEQNTKLSNNFLNNRGKLPWPIPMHNAVITENFGKTTNAAGNEVINDGIYISTTEGQSVRSVFSGQVTLISKVPSYGNVVIIQHGKFRTVYANLETVNVEKGSHVEVLQNIGTVKTSHATGGTLLYFQIYREFNPINPAIWLAGKDD